MHMKNLLTISKDVSIKVNSQVTNFLEPTKIYLPLDEKIEIQKSKVKKGEKLYSYQNKDIYSSVSGQIVGKQKIQNTWYLVIKNDYREEDKYNGLSDFTRTSMYTNFQAKITDSNLFDWKMFKNKTALILNGIEDEPYIANKTFLHKDETEAILQMLDCLATTYEIPTVKIYLKETDRESIEAFHEYNGTFENIEVCILPDYYPIGNEKVLRSYLKIADEAIVLSTYQIYDMYVNLIRERSNDVTLLTVTGDMMEDPQVFRVKKGTLFKELRDCFTLKEGEYVSFVNGLMKREKKDLETLIISDDIQAVYFMKPLYNKTKPCLHCGKCSEVCPVKCNPYLALQTQKKLDSCLQCGLCTFVCPSYIDVANLVSKKEVK